ncbi:hypothetical protein BOO71_0006403 [Deinococcus marmoris]|uniref:Uncharacterized protein n=1 Tax=Deinococcus marmoris TaxID=249408 RepID=A0A1U7NZ89_9DEIO|nr:hypothetical protein BOO71_0006403 [Deinococcus marmoris]
MRGWGGLDLEAAQAGQTGSDLLAQEAVCSEDQDIHALSPITIRSGAS